MPKVKYSQSRGLFQVAGSGLDLDGTVNHNGTVNLNQKVASGYLRWCMGDHSGLSLLTKTDANCDSGFTAAANTLHECAALGDATNAYVLPEATVGTVVVFKFTAQYDGGNNATFTTTAGDFFAAQTLNFLTLNSDAGAVGPRIIGTDFTTTQSVGKISTLTAAHNRITMSTTATNNHTNVGSELSFFCEDAGFWRVLFQGVCLGNGAMNATFAGSTA